ncbi:hypothetical protein NL676_018516 [Syzygium grande]|nr:hypothetical protein NL676_018516 [Syzygium grande]
MSLSPSLGRGTVRIVAAAYAVHRIATDHRHRRRELLGARDPQCPDGVVTDPSTSAEESASSDGIPVEYEVDEPESMDLEPVDLDAVSEPMELGDEEPEPIEENPVSEVEPKDMDSEEEAAEAESKLDSSDSEEKMSDSSSSSESSDSDLD